MQKSGFIAILGRPNVGKSTLLNRIVGKKVSIVTEKPQTTRNRIMGIKTAGEAQMVFIDTPGIYEGNLELCQYMRKQALMALKGVDLVLFVTDRHGNVHDDDAYILSRIKQRQVPAFFILNKVDKMGPESVLQTIDRFQKIFPFGEFFPVSALKEGSTDAIEEKIISSLPEGPFYFPGDMSTDQSEKFLISELVREKIFQLTKQEVPYSTAVVVEDISEGKKKGVLVVYCAIYMERDSQKGILIGKGGGLLKKIGTMAREEMEHRLGTRIYLDLQVRVKKDWSHSPRYIKDMGYE
ncbi:MAG: GTPase Era [Nitrospinae bacterium]|nr:GTPase Era [Nitrospinota bacterium]